MEIKICPYFKGNCRLDKCAAMVPKNIECINTKKCEIRRKSFREGLRTTISDNINPYGTLANEPRCDNCIHKELVETGTCKLLEVNIKWKLNQ